MAGLTIRPFLFLLIFNKQDAELSIFFCENLSINVPLRQREIIYYARLKNRKLCIIYYAFNKRNDERIE